jgi:quercetin dioxygenase-like cupin family protein
MGNGPRLTTALALAFLPATAPASPPPVEVLLDNPQVRILRAADVSAVAGIVDAVVIPLADGPSRKAGEAYWSGSTPSPGVAGPVVVVEPRTGRVWSASPTPGASPPSFVGLSFKPLFENNRVAVMRGRMDAGAHEDFHTHPVDMVVVHLSGGTIEDTAGGKTVVHTWRRGEVEFEGAGTSHSSRNLADAVDAILVHIKPRT